MTAEAHVEIALAQDADPLRQGDVVEFETETALPKLGIIVTADCDIEHQKFGPTLTYVVAISLAEYLERHYLTDELSKERNKAFLQVCIQINKMREAYRPNFPEKISDGTIATWLEDDDTPSILSTLNVPDARTGKKLADAIDRWRSLTEGQASSVGEQIGTIAKARDCPVSAVHRRIHEHVKSLPGDKMYFSSLGAKTNQGFVVLLRALREIAPSDIAIRPSNHRMLGKRVARLASPFRYRLTQQLAEIFSSIGLPAEYERSRDETLHGSFALTTD